MRFSTSPVSVHTERCAEKHIGWSRVRVTPTVWQTNLAFYVILAQQEKLGSNSLTNQLVKNRNMAKLTSPRAYMRPRIVVAIVVSL
jgi:hypothetical protein